MSQDVASTTVQRGTKGYMRVLAHCTRGDCRFAAWRTGERDSPTAELLPQWAHFLDPSAEVPSEEDRDALYERIIKAADDIDTLLFGGLPIDAWTVRTLDEFLAAGETGKFILREDQFLRSQSEAELLGLDETKLRPMTVRPNPKKSTKK